MPKKKDVSAAAKALAEQSRRKRMRTMTAEQRSQQARRAVAARRDRQPKGPWYGLVLLPDYKGSGLARAGKAVDDALADTAHAIFWSTDKAEVRKRARPEALAGRSPLIVEQDWNPNAFSVKREYQPGDGALRRLLAGGEA